MGTMTKDLESVSAFNATDCVVLDDGSSTKKMPTSVLVPNTAAAHNQFCRGKVLTDYYTLVEILAMIADRNYNDIFVGDIIKASVPAISVTGFGAATVSFLVAEIESHWNYGDSANLNKGHVLLVPSGRLGTAYMNDTNTTEGGYDGSYMDDTVMPAVQTALESAFGADHVLTAREFLTSVVDTTHQSAGLPNSTGCTTYTSDWVDCKCRLMTELEVYGGDIFSSSGVDSLAGLPHQIALFAADSSAVHIRASWWLSAVASVAAFCSVSGSGVAGYYNASHVCGVRPRFIIG